MNNNTRKITDGAMMTAIVGVLLLVNRQFAGLLEEFLLFLFPLPMVFYAAKYGRKSSWVVYIAMALLSFIVSTPQTIFFVLSESLIGLIYGAGVYEKKDGRKLVWITILIAIFVNVFSTLIYASFFGYDIAREIEEVKGLMGEMMVQTGTQLPSTINFEEYIKTILVVTVVLTGVLQGFIAHMLSRVMLKRLRYDVPEISPVAQYYPPSWSGYLGIIGMMLFYVSSFRPFGTQMTQNLCQGIGVFGVFYLIAYGMIAMMVYGLVRYPNRRGLIVLVCFILMMAFSLFVELLGFLYITTDWHKKMLGGNSHATSAK